VKITLPVGISFYTFHSMGYIVDLYRGRTKVEKSFLRYAIYVAFFPQLVAGPILRSYQFLPQLNSPVDLLRHNLRSGINLFIVGLVKKVLIADHMAPLANFVFDSPQLLPSPIIWLGTLAFGIQIYCDFSGYTDMAIGCARMMGYEIPINFNHPYIARSITDFWRRWHISLSSWLRDYLYISLGGNRKGTANTYRNLMLTMGLGGLWHGAGWNFVIWGLYQGVLLCIERLFGIPAAQERTDSATPPRQWPRWPKVLLTWLFVQYLVFLGWLIFRVHNWKDLTYCAKKYLIFDFDFRLSSLGMGSVSPFVICGVLVSFIVLHAISLKVGGFGKLLDRMRWPARSLAYAVVVIALIALWPSERTAFIYFQF
jgi:alginate O-acetyltransferase complex protein AlgI